MFWQSADASALEDDNEDAVDLEDSEDMIEAKVPAGKKLKLEYQVDVPQTQIWYAVEQILLSHSIRE